MARFRQIVVLFAAISLPSALFGQALAIGDDSGVAVNLNGARLIHRSPVRYPAKDVVGTVVVQVKLDANGEVMEAVTLSGPSELGASARDSVATWHFDGRAGAATREVKIDFGGSVDSVAPLSRITTEVGISDAPPQPPAPQSGTIDQIDVTGLSDTAADELLAGFPVHPGDRLVGDVLTRAKDAASQFDSHLMVEISRGMSAENVMRIRPRETPAGAMLVKSDRPVFPPLAKMARQHGAVKFEATVGKDGKVEDLKLLSGPPLLVAAAKDAVEKWVYQPTLLGGLPVKMVTTINVDFDLEPKDVGGLVTIGAH